VARARHEAGDPRSAPLSDAQQRTLLDEASRLRDAGDAAAARQRLDEALRAEPRNGEAAALMAALAADDGAFEEGMCWIERALAAAPLAFAHYTRGRLLQGEGRLPEAAQSYQRSIELDPERAAAWNNLGCVQHMQGQLDLAQASYRRALALDPLLPQANQNLSAIESDPAMAEGAVAGYRRQLERNPKDAQAHNNLGNVYRELGRHREALACFDAAIACDPGFAEARFSRSQELLLTGDFERGWQDHESRWQVRGLGMALPDLRGPLWEGEPLPGGTLLLHAEQGLGDTIQFARYAAMAAKRCGQVLLQCHPQIAGLLREVPGLARVIPRGEPLPAFDAHLPVMSLPRVFGTTVQTIPWNGPYLRADPVLVERWRREREPAKGGAAARLHVGLAWAGRPQYWDDRKRSIPLALFAPLARVGGVAFYSLQWGQGTDQLATAPASLRVRDFGDGIREFVEMAALAASLDLVISVDSSVAHLAGAMGRPVWLLIAHAPEWRWLLEREDTPWYPATRLFRQSAPGDWPGVLERVAAELERLAAR